MDMVNAPIGKRRTLEVYKLEFNIFMEMYKLFVEKEILCLVYFPNIYIK